MSVETTYLAYNAMIPLDTQRFTADLLFSPVLTKFPTIKFSLSEGGIGWIPYYLERAAQVVDKQRYWANQTMFSLDRATLTMQVHQAGGVDLMDFDLRQTFRDHIYGCFIDDLYGIRNIDLIGVDNVMIETDYPHSDSTWPDCLEHAHKQLAGLDPADAYKVLRANAERVFSFRPADAPQ